MLDFISIRSIVLVYTHLSIYENYVPLFFRKKKKKIMEGDATPKHQLSNHFKYLSLQLIKHNSASRVNCFFITLKMLTQDLDLYGISNVTIYFVVDICQNI